jgi:hypothetical protein
VGFVVVVAYRPVVRPSASVRDVVLSYVGTTFAVVTVTSILIGVLFAAFQHVPPPHSEEEEVEE